MAPNAKPRATIGTVIQSQRLFHRTGRRRSLAQTYRRDAHQLPLLDARRPTRKEIRLTASRRPGPPRPMYGKGGKASIIGRKPRALFPPKSQASTKRGSTLLFMTESGALFVQNLISSGRRRHPDACLHVKSISATPLSGSYTLIGEPIGARARQLAPKIGGPAKPEGCFEWGSLFYFNRQALRSKRARIQRTDMGTSVDSSRLSHTDLSFRPLFFSFVFLRNTGEHLQCDCPIRRGVDSRIPFVARLISGCCSLECIVISFSAMWCGSPPFPRTVTTRKSLPGSVPATTGGCRYEFTSTVRSACFERTESNDSKRASTALAQDRGSKTAR